MRQSVAEAPNSARRSHTACGARMPSSTAQPSAVCKRLRGRVTDGGSGGGGSSRGGSRKRRHRQQWRPRRHAAASGAPASRRPNPFARSRTRAKTQAQAELETRLPGPWSASSLGALDSGAAARASSECVRPAAHVAPRRVGGMWPLAAATKLQIESSASCGNPRVSLVVGMPSGALHHQTACRARRLPRRHGPPAGRPPARPPQKASRATAGSRCTPVVRLGPLPALCSTTPRPCHTLGGHWLGQQRALQGMIRPEGDAFRVSRRRHGPRAACLLPLPPPARSPPARPPAPAGGAPLRRPGLRGALGSICPGGRQGGAVPHK